MTDREICLIRQFSHLQSRIQNATKDKNEADFSQSIYTNQKTSFAVSNNDQKKTSLCNKFSEKNLYNNIRSITDQKISRYYIIISALTEYTDKNLRAVQFNQLIAVFIIISSNIVMRIIKKRSLKFKSKKRDHITMHN